MTSFRAPTRILIRAILVATLLLGHPGALSVAQQEPSAPADTILVCESEPAEDSDGVSIGTALRMYRDADPSEVAADCIGAVRTL